MGFEDEQASQFNILKNPYVDNFTSVSGSDIVGVFGHVEFINLQGVSVSVNREVHPIYVMGRTDPISFVRGKRGVAGSLVTIAADRGAMFDIIEKFGVYARSVGDRPANTQYGSHGRSRESQTDRLTNNVLSETDRLGFELSVPDYADQLPPFDVTLVGRSDSMAATLSRIGGVFIVSMGTGISVDDNSIEQQMTFVALFYEDWRPAGRRNWQDFDRPDEETRNPFTGEQGQSLPTDEPQDNLQGEFGLSPLDENTSQ
jgi:hypothetical protein